MNVSARIQQFESRNKIIAKDSVEDAFNFSTNDDLIPGSTDNNTNNDIIHSSTTNSTNECGKNSLTLPNVCRDDPLMHTNGDNIINATKDLVISSGKDMLLHPNDINMNSENMKRHLNSIDTVTRHSSSIDNVARHSSSIDNVTRHSSSIESSGDGLGEYRVLDDILEEESADEDGCETSPGYTDQGSSGKFTNCSFLVIKFSHWILIIISKSDCHVRLYIYKSKNFVLAL